ncbi:hypothetical protein sos41_35760 [Alphaproteobacteria bacterium SO-S41]|nr:hypothetical protein sos41_35760 [Alphaproteobacteria bacterium SO-S41]
MLVIFAGLPGTGKSTLARALAQSERFTLLRIDSIEQALRDNGVTEIEGRGYAAAYAIAADNLKLGLGVVADSVNPIALTRNAWRAVAAEAGVPAVDVEVICSDKAEHRRRLEARAIAMPDHPPVSWAEVEAREYDAWDRDRIVIDTAGRDIEVCVAELIARVRSA